MGVDVDGKFVDPPIVELEKFKKSLLKEFIEALRYIKRKDHSNQTSGFNEGLSAASKLLEDILDYDNDKKTI